MRNDRFSQAVVAASATAGPLFLFSLIGATLFLQMPEAVPVSIPRVVGFVAVLVMAFLFGFVLAIGPVALGTAAMGALARRFDAAQSPTAWIAAGTLCGAGLAALFAPSDAFVFALITTSTACAAVCWQIVRPDESRGEQA